MAWIWFSYFCWASENWRSIPASSAACWIDSVFAVRQPLSAPTWEKPKVMVSSSAVDDSLEPQAVAAASTITATGPRSLFMTDCPSFVVSRSHDRMGDQDH